MDDGADDLPILTEVLRLRGRSTPLAPSTDARVEAAPAAPPPEPMLPPQIVIGHDAPATLEPYARIEPVFGADREPMSGDEALLEPMRERSDPSPLVSTGFYADVDDEPADIERPPPARLTDDELASIAARLQETLLADLSARIDTELDARIAQALHAEVETALGGLQDRLRGHLAEGLRDVVRRAVDDEIARLASTPHDEKS